MEFLGKARRQDYLGSKLDFSEDLGSTRLWDWRPL